MVWEGRRPGIYNNWAECKAQIDAFPDAKYRSYSTEEEAEKAYLLGFYASMPSDSSQTKAKKSSSAKAKIKKRQIPNSEIITNSICVDAACSGNPGVMEYRGVYTHNHEEIFRKGPYPLGTNNIGEFLGIVYAIALLKKNKHFDTAIYTDSRTAMAWVRKKKANTKLFEKYQNPALEEIVIKAEQWLKNNSYTNPIVKWETKLWGEIPADFGRK